MTTYITEILQAGNTTDDENDFQENGDIKIDYWMKDDGAYLTCLISKQFREKT